MLLDRQFQEAAPSVVLEGAPGQGKSTLAQYVCQVHRARLLSRGDFLAAISEQHRKAAVRLPFKVDLRDFATWLSRRDPFIPQQSEVNTANWAPTLEGFIARLVSFHAGGAQFTVDDVTETLQRVPSLLFLDGLDEVADIDLRASIVDGVRSTLSRVAANGGDVQVVVTSRPTSFEVSPTFESPQFKYLELLDIKRDLILEYSERWITARDLDEQDANDVRRILMGKLDLPHIRDLARNPMQLAILLTLIHSVGYSLPDQRTELYSSYMGKFLTREAEKSPAVRRHRDLLVRLHQHLAWVLQSEAEGTQGASGSVSPERLRELIEQYLVEHEHPSDILDDLFSGVLERVYVLVQRIEGAYEFEVQPIREFFCARHLYETASGQARAGETTGGTRDMRFSAIARNPYWTNVTRFYAGSYTSGELGGLYLLIEDYKEDLSSELLFRPRHLGAMLLSDWTFKDNPRAVRHMTQCVFDDLGLKAASRGFNGSHPGAPFELPNGCGREELQSRILEVLRDDISNPSATELAALLAANGGAPVQKPLIDLLQAADGDARTFWVRIAATAGLLRQFSLEECKSLLLADSPSASQLLSRGQSVLQFAPEIAETLKEITANLINVALEGRGTLKGGRNSWLDELNTWTSTAAALNRLRQRSLTWVEQVEGTKSRREVDAGFTHVNSFLADLDGLAADNEKHGWRTSLTPWSSLLLTIADHFGECWSTYAIAVICAGIKAPAEKGDVRHGIFDEGTPLAQRARGARLKGARQPDWWREQYATADSGMQRMFWLLLVFVWSSSSVLTAIQDEVSACLDELTEDEYRRLLVTTHQIAILRSRTSEKNPVSISLTGRSPRFAGALVARLRSSVDLADLASVSRLPDSSVSIYAGRELLLRHVASLEKIDSDKQLAVIREAYAKRAVSAWAGTRAVEMSATAVKAVLTQPFLYPQYLVSRAELQQRSSLKLRPVARVSQIEGWTFE